MTKGRYPWRLAGRGIGKTKSEGKCETYRVQRVAACGIMRELFFTILFLKKKNTIIGNVPCKTGYTTQKRYQVHCVASQTHEPKSITHFTKAANNFL